GGKIEGPGEHGEPPEEDALVGLEEVVAPLQRRRERLLSRRRSRAGAAQELKAVCEPLSERGRGERAAAAGRKLEREREPVQPEANACDVGRVRLVELEARRGRLRPLDEQPNCLVSKQPLRRLVVAGGGNRERRHAEDDLARDSQGLAARR